MDDKTTLKFAILLYRDSLTRTLRAIDGNQGLSDYEILFGIETWAKNFRESMEDDFRAGLGSPHSG